MLNVPFLCELRKFIADQIWCIVCSYIIRTTESGEMQF